MTDTKNRPLPYNMMFNIMAFPKDQVLSQFFRTRNKISARCKKAIELEASDSGSTNFREEIFFNLSLDRFRLIED